MSMKAALVLLIPVLIASGCIGQVPTTQQQQAQQPPAPSGGTASGSITLQVPICRLLRIDTDNTRHFRIESEGTVTGTLGVILRVSYSGQFTTTGTSRSIDCTGWTEVSGGTECTRSTGELATTGWKGAWGEHSIAPGTGRVDVEVRAELYSPAGSLIDTKTSTTVCE